MREYSLATREYYETSVQLSRRFVSTRYSYRKRRC